MRKVESYVYNYNELTGYAKENAYNAVIDSMVDETLQDFNRTAEQVLNEDYPNSDLHLQYDFSCCQGSGLNIYGMFNLSDFFSRWNCSDKKLERTIKFYIDILTKCGWQSSLDIELSDNRSYAYSMKFIDERNAEWIAEEIANDIKWNGIANVKVDAIETFIGDMFDYLTRIENEWYKEGCDCIDFTNEQVNDFCSGCGIEFTKYGRIA